MLTLFPRFVDWFLAKKSHFVTFADTDTRLEGWFKGETLVLLEGLAKEDLVGSFQREFNIPTPGAPKKRRHIDFRIQSPSGYHLCELKAMCTSQAAGTPRNLDFYLKDDDMGIIRDMRKLPSLPIQDHLWLLAFIYPSPSQPKWDEAVKKISTLCPTWRCMSTPSEFPPHLYMSLWNSPRPK